MYRTFAPPTCTASPDTMLWNSACSIWRSALISGATNMNLSLNADRPNLRSMLLLTTPTSCGSKRLRHTDMRMVDLPDDAWPLRYGMTCHRSSSPTP